MLRRALLLILVLLLPLKVAAAGVVSLVGAPGHTHSASAFDEEAQSAAAHADHAGCAYQTGDTPSTPLHDHACPHLGMASITPAALTTGPECAAVARPAAPLPRFSSICHDVPSPIPLTVSV